MPEETEYLWNVYCHTNKINNKKYFGITYHSPQSRWGRNGSKYKKNVHFYGAIQKYGWDNFEHEILYTEQTKLSACEKEIYLISLFKTTEPDFGYNISTGGEAGSGMLNGTNSREVVQYTLDGKYKATYNSISEAIRETKLLVHGGSISQCCNGKAVSAGNYQWKYKIDVNNILEIDPVDNWKIRNGNQQKNRILQYGLDGSFIQEWDSAHDAYMTTNISASSITGCCLGRYVSVGDFQWRKKESDEYPLSIDKVASLIVRKTEKNNKKIIQIDVNTKNILNEFSSLIEAVKFTGYYRNYIIDCCKGRLDSYKECFWKYANS
jgi:hypothetical protein